MYVEEQEKAFKPVKLILETQEEVDKLYAVFNFMSLITALKRSGSNPLSGYQTNDYNIWHHRLNKIIK